MADFVMLVSYTKQGIEKVKQSPNRLDAARDTAKSMGVDIKAFYLAMGQYDSVIVGDREMCGPRRCACSRRMTSGRLLRNYPRYPDSSAQSLRGAPQLAGFLVAAISRMMIAWPLIT
jgi:hypothetical protein